MKRLISLMLVLLLCISLFPLSVFAEDAEPAAPEESLTESTLEELPEGVSAEPEEAENLLPETLEFAPATEPEILPEAAEQPTDGASIVASGCCGAEGDGSNLTWTLDSNGLLTISGTGKMKNYSLNSLFLYVDTPWYSNRNSIKTIVIVDGVTSIGKLAFYNCSALTSITIPNSVTTIGADAFVYCESLTSVTLPNSLTIIGGCAFADCSNLKSVNIPDSVTNIWDRAFECCESLESVTIGAGVINIGEVVFGQCESLVTIAVSSKNKNFTSVDGVLFNKAKTEIICYPGGRTEESYEIPKGVTSIQTGAFCHCHNLTSITIPDSVKNIGQGAFEIYYEEQDRPYLRDVYYTGSEEQWNEISIDGRPIWDGGYDCLANATIHYNSTGSGTGSVSYPLTTLDYLAFSQLAYGNLTGGTTVAEHIAGKTGKEVWSKSDLGVTYGELCKNILNWECVLIWDHDETSGFYAAAFYNNDLGQYLITYRGSKNIEELCDIVTDDGTRADWLENDFPFMGDHKVTTQLKEALEFYDELLKENNSASAKNTVLTGHSLGGALAQVVSLQRNVSAEVFNSASVFEALYLNSDWFADMAENFNGMDKWPCTKHVVDGDFVGTYGGEYKYGQYSLYDNGTGDSSTSAAKFHGLHNFLKRDEDDNVCMKPPVETGCKTTFYLNYSFHFKYLYLGDSKSNEKVVKFFDSDVNKAVLYGGEGNDTLISTGLSTNDYLTGGKADVCDVLDGGHGNDTYVYWYQDGCGDLIIRDTSGRDKLLLYGVSASDEVTWDFSSLMYNSGDYYYTIWINGKPVIYVSPDRSIASTLTLETPYETTKFKVGIWRKVTSARIACPTTVEILDPNGNVVLMLEGGEEQTIYKPYGNFYVFLNEETGEWEKQYDLQEGYTARIKGTDDGTMDVELLIEDENGKEQYFKAENIPVTETMVAEFDGQDPSKLNIDSDGDNEVDSVVSLNNVPIDDPEDEPEDNKQSDGQSDRKTNQTTHQSDDVAKTGDTALPGLWLSMLLISTAVFAGMIEKRKKKER